MSADPAEPVKPDPEKPAPRRRGSPRLRPRPEPEGPFNLLTEIARFRAPITAEQLADMLNTSRQTIYEMERKGKLPRKMIIPGLDKVQFDPKALALHFAAYDPKLALAAKARVS